MPIFKTNNKNNHLNYRKHKIINILNKSNLIISNKNIHNSNGIKKYEI